MQNETISLILFHGSRRKEAIDKGNSFVENISKQISEKKILPCYLSNGIPDLKSAILNAIDQGAKQINIYPLFVLPGKHTLFDIPQIIKEIAQEKPDTKVCLKDILTEDSQFIDYISHKISMES